MNWFSLNGTIGRWEFVRRLLVICASLALVFYWASDAIESAVGLKGYVLLKSASGSLMVVLCIPSIMKRLRDINWTAQLAWLYLAAGLLSVQNIILFSSLVLEVRFISATTMTPFLVINIAALAVLLVLVFKRGVPPSGRSTAP